MHAVDFWTQENSNRHSGYTFKQQQQKVVHLSLRLSRILLGLNLLQLFFSLKFSKLYFSNTSDAMKKRLIKSDYPGCFQSTAIQFVRARVEIKSNSSVREREKKVQKTFVVDKKVNCFQFI